MSEFYATPAATPNVEASATYSVRYPHPRHCVSLFLCADSTTRHENNFELLANHNGTQWESNNVFSICRKTRGLRRGK
jgi:hypothetical protein